MRTRVHRLMWIALLLIPLVVGCGGSSSTNIGGTGGNGGGGGSTAGDAQGVYSGTSSSGYSFETIVLPNDKFYGIYGTLSGTTLLVYGLITGQGVSGTSTYTVSSLNDFFYTGTVTPGSISANYVAGTSVSGTETEGATATTFNGTAIPAADFNFETAASVSNITGTWDGALLDGSSATVTIGSNGAVSGSNEGCSFSGTVAADSSNKNFYDVSLTFGASPCLLPNQTATGVGVYYLLSNGTTHQLLAGVTVGSTEGTVFVATR
jgi:hypothetical protein